MNVLLSNFPFQRLLHSPNNWIYTFLGINSQLLLLQEFGLEGVFLKHLGRESVEELAYSEWTDSAGRFSKRSEARHTEHGGARGGLC